MSDQKLGKHIGYAQQTIAKSRRGWMSDQVAMKIAEILEIEAGELIWIARVEREHDPAVRRHLEAWGMQVGKLLSQVPRNLAAFVAAVTLGRPCRRMMRRHFAEPEASTTHRASRLQQS